MKVLLLVIITAWSFAGGYYPYPPQIEVVGSIQTASIKVWEDEQLNELMVESDHKVYHLYEIDLEKKTINELEIPELKFEKSNPKK